MEPRYTIGVCVRDELLHVTLTGEVDMLTVPRIRDQITAHSDGPRPAGTVVDLGGVTFLDSAGINLLLDLRNSSLAAGTVFRVDGACGPPAAVLEMTGIADLFARDAASTYVTGGLDGPPHGDDRAHT